MRPPVRLAIGVAALTLLAYLGALTAVALYTTGWIGVLQLLVVGVLGRAGLAQVNT